MNQSHPCLVLIDTTTFWFFPATCKGLLSCPAPADTDPVTEPVATETKDAGFV
jgi:hypothetical protein